MNKLVTALLVITILLCVINFNANGEDDVKVFNLMDLIEWFEDFGEDMPPLLTDFSSEADNWGESVLGGIADFFSIFTFPIRFLGFLIPKIFDFLFTFIFYGTSFSY